MDERFEVSADMRLLELQRRALGVAQPPAATWRSRAAAEPVPEPPPAPAPQAGPILTAVLDAAPRAGLIPGALVTVTLAVSNGGGAVARDVTVTMPLPLDAAYAPGSLRLDGAAASDERAGDLFGAGLGLGDFAASVRRTIVARLTVAPAAGDLLIGAHVRAASGGVAGPGSIRLTRGTAPARPPADERPFYEPDAEEETTAVADLPAPATIAVVQPQELPPAPQPPAAEPAPALTAPAPAPAAAPPGLRQLRGTGGPVLTATIDRRRFTALAALFRDKSLGMIAHYLVLNALAVVTPLADDGEAPELAAFVSAQERLLTRALVSQRLGKPVTPESVAALFPAFPPPLRGRSETLELPEAAAGTLVLARAFTEHEIAFLGGMLANAGSPPFLRAAQLFVGLCASDAALPGDAERRRLATVLATYAGLAAAEINRIFLRAKLTRTPALFKDAAPDLDEAARAVIGAIGAALG